MIKFKTLIVAASVITATVSFAQTPQPHAAGKGIAKNRENAAKFELRAGQNRQGELNAAFNITVGGDDAPNRVHIELKRANEFNINRERQSAALNGLAVLVVKNGEGVRRVEGRVEIIVVDLVQPNNDSQTDAINDREPHDRVIVKFKALESDLTYSFEGLVSRGDIRIGAPIRDR